MSPQKHMGMGVGMWGERGAGMSKSDPSLSCSTRRPPFRQWVLGKGIDPLAQGESMEARLSLGI